MKFLELLEQGETVKAVKEIKSKMDGYKSGKLIDLEDEVKEKYSNKKNGVNEEEIETPDLLKMDDEKADKERAKYNKKVYKYVRDLLKKVEEMGGGDFLEKILKKNRKAVGKESNLDVFDTASVLKKEFESQNLAYLGRQPIGDFERMYDYAKDLEKFIEDYKNEKL